METLLKLQRTVRKRNQKESYFLKNDSEIQAYKQVFTDIISDRIQDLKV